MTGCGRDTDPHPSFLEQWGEGAGENVLKNLNGYYRPRKHFTQLVFPVNVLLIHVGADIKNPGVVGPIFPDGSFEFIPINNFYGHETLTYADFPARNKRFGETLGDFLPSNVARLNPHIDPDFVGYTYGEPNNPEPRPRVLQMLSLGDFLFFISSLAPHDSAAYQARDSMLRPYQRGRKDKYVIGFFKVKGVVRVYAIRSIPMVTVALLNLLSLLEEGEGILDSRDLTNQLEILAQMGYANQKENRYEITEKGKRVAEELDYVLGVRKSDDEKRKLLEEGLFDVEPVAGSISEEILKTNHHFKRLRPVDWDNFIVVAGEPEGSALLARAVRLTEGYERFSFRLNQLGRSILGRDMDTLRGARWIDEKAGKLLAEAIAKTNPDLRADL